MQQRSSLASGVVRFIEALGDSVEAAADLLDPTAESAEEAHSKHKADESPDGQENREQHRDHECDIAAGQR